MNTTLLNHTLYVTVEPARIFYRPFFRVERPSIGRFLGR